MVASARRQASRGSLVTCARWLSSASLALAVPALAGAAEATQAAQGARVENVIYGFAEVLRADPVYERVLVTEQEERCDDGAQYERVDGRRSVGGAVAGALIGGVVGNQVGDGSGRRAATAAGAVAGGVVGERIGRNQDGGPAETVIGPGCQLVQVDREVNQLAGYDVEYRYRGNHFISRVVEDPGDGMRIRIAVSPATEADLR